MQNNQGKIQEITFIHNATENVVAELEIIVEPSQNFVTQAYTAIAKRFNIHINEARLMFDIN